MEEGRAAPGASADLVTIYTSRNDLDIVRRVLPGILAEAERTGTAVIVHDSSTKDTATTWEWYRALSETHKFFYIFTGQIPFAMARNMALSTAIEMYTPQYVCMLEDDHGYRPGAVDALRQAMKSHYGMPSPNGLRYGLFSLCPFCWGEKFHQNCNSDGAGNLYPPAETEPMQLGGANSCCRCAPVSHWLSVLKGHDPDEYPISFYQTRNLNWRNYHRGFTTLYVGGGRLVHREERPGTGANMLNVRFDDRFTASDRRSATRKA